MLASFAAKLRRHLSDDRGFALIDSMVGVMVLAMAATFVAASAFTVSTALHSVATASDRQIAARSLVNTLATNPSVVPTTVTATTVQAGGVTIPADELQVVSSTSTLLRVEVPRGSASCTNLTTPDYTDCIVADVTISSAQPHTSAACTSSTCGTVSSSDNVTLDSMATVTSGTVLATLTPTTGTTSVNWVIQVNPSGGPARLQFSGSTGDYAFDGSTQFLYGTIPVTAGTPVSLVWAGSTGTADDLMFYEVTS